MYIIYIICFILLLIGAFCLFNITPSKLSEDVDKIKDLKPNDIRALAEKAQRTKKRSALAEFFSDTYEIMTYMKATGRFVIICCVSMALMIVGILLVSLFNVYYIPGIVVLCLALPFLFVHQIFYRYTRTVMKELEITLNQITNSYIRSEKILESVEENLPLINPPIKKYFQEFVAQIRYVNPNEKEAIEDLSEKIDDNIFKEWCEAFKKCSSNRTLKYLLNPSLTKYTTVKVLDDKIKFELFGIKMSYWVVMGLVYSNYLLLYFINKEWFDILINTQQGLIAGGILFFLSVACSVLMSFMTKPLKYKL